MTGAYVIPGPSPRVVGFLGASVQSLRGQGDLWMTVTDRRVLFLRTTFMTQKPRGFAWADARYAVSIDEIHGDERSGWNWFVYLRATEDPLRLNLSMIWNEEFDGIIGALSSRLDMPPMEDWPEQ